MHLPISLDNTLHFYWYLKNTYSQQTDKFCSTLKLPTQDRAQQLQIYEIFNLPVPHSEISAKYKIYNKYVGVSYDETQAVMITEQQFSIFLNMQMDNSPK